MKFYTAKYDRVFKTILCNEEDTKLFQEFLSRILKKKVIIVEFLRNELPVNGVEEKVKTIDVLVKVDNDYIHIELNTNYNNYLHVRNYIYFSTLYSNKVKRGEKYDLITKFLHLDFTYGMGLKREEETSYYIQNKEGDKYLENIEIIEYNMDKIMKYWYNEDIQKVNKYKHLIMLDLETKELEKLSKGDDFVKEFNEKITKLNEKETFQSAMTYEEDQRLILNTEKSISYNEGMEKGLEQGKEEGKEEGEKNKQLEIAKNLLSLNMDINNISKATGLSLNEINSLK